MLILYRVSGWHQRGFATTNEQYPLSCRAVGIFVGHLGVLVLFWRSADLAFPHGPQLGLRGTDFSNGAAGSTFVYPDGLEQCCRLARPTRLGHWHWLRGGMVALSHGSARIIHDSTGVSRRDAL